MTPNQMKLQAFNEALEVAARVFAAKGHTLTDPNTKTTIKKEPEPYARGAHEADINTAYAKLALHSHRQETVAKYQQIVSGNASPATFGELIASMRRELGGGVLIPPEQYAWVYGERKDVPGQALPTNPPAFG